ncbi:AraC family transcriptional regulator [Bradyrhizobium sp. AS23.2]|uniref:AraC family transcriptional regulator n=1 Tax=Bradyrhizobium sp. AS23.2 TaxID=1680155 RepID=UPI00093C4154|nr:AraC family transcriptional regulator [Bradyrhizobium sp. AS23.2]
MSTNVSIQPRPASDIGSYRSEGLLSSASLGWSGMSAELRNHEKAVIPWRGSNSGVVMCIDLRGNGTLVTRRSASIEDRRISSLDTIWLTPPDLQEGEIDLAADMADMLHLHLPLSQFSPGYFGPLRYEAAFEDPLLAEIAHAVASELQAQTSAGGLLIDSLATSMTARLTQKHMDAPPAHSSSWMTREGLDQRRLSRVLDHIEANLEGELTIETMSTVACLSRYHFSRAFKKATGQSPHRYVGGRRLERAKALLLNGDRSLVNIALTLSFSSQANFTRAFTKATGQAPGQFRKRNGARSLAADSLTIKPEYAQDIAWLRERIA